MNNIPGSDSSPQQVIDVTRTLSRCPDPPNVQAISTAETNLKALQALDSTDGMLTPLGRHMAALPCDPRISKLLIYGSLLGCTYAGSAIAACLSTRGIFQTNPEFRNVVDAAKDYFIKASPSDMSSDHIIYITAIRLFDQAGDKRRYHLISMHL